MDISETDWINPCNYKDIQLKLINKKTEILPKTYEKDVFSILVSVVTSTLSTQSANLGVHF